MRKIFKAVIFIAGISCFIAAPAFAGSLSVSVTDSKSALLANVVVMLTPQFDMPTMKMPSHAKEMRQENSLFAPFVLPVHVGETVTFPNFDEFRHHVYSFSKAKRFELRLYGKDETNSIVFDKPGVVALGCNIHDNMLSYIYVTDAPIMAKTNTDGVIMFDDLSAGNYTLTYWHPGIKKNGAPKPKTITITDVGLNETAVLDLRRVWGEQSPPAEGQY